MDVSVVFGSLASHVPHVAGSVLVFTAGVLLDFLPPSHSLHVAGSVLVAGADLLVVVLDHSDHVLGSSLVVLVLTAGVLLPSQSAHGWLSVLVAVLGLLLVVELLHSLQVDGS